MRIAIALGAAGIGALVALWLASDSIWLRAQLGGADSQLKLAYAYGTGQGAALDQERAARWYRRAAEQGDVRAQLALAARHDEGLGVVRDEVQAAEWYRRAAENGSATAQVALALRCAAGRGVPPDKIQAAAWLLLAGRDAQEDASAARLLERLRRELSPEELAQARDRAADWRRVHGGAGS